MFTVTMWVCGIAQYTYDRLPTFADAAREAARYARIASETGWDGLFTITVSAR